VAERLPCHFIKKELYFSFKEFLFYFIFIFKYKINLSMKFSEAWKIKVGNMPETTLQPPQISSNDSIHARCRAD